MRKYTEEELKKIWNENPNKVEQIMLQQRTNSEYTKIRNLIKELISKTDVIEQRTGEGVGYRELGTGLVHRNQDSEIEMETIFGLKKINPKEFIKSIEENADKSYEWLSKIFDKNEIIDIYLSRKGVAIQKIAKKLKEKESELTKDILNAPELFMGGVLQYLWNKIVKIPGTIENVEIEKFSMKVFIPSGAGTFVGTNGANLNKIKDIIGEYNISVISNESNTEE